MTLKPILMATGLSLALLVSSGAGAADVKSMAVDAAKDQAADLAKEKATDMAKDQAEAIMPATGGAAVIKVAPGAAAVPGVDATKAVTGAAKLPGATVVPAVDPTKAATETAEDLAKKKAAEAVKGVVK